MLTSEQSIVEYRAGRAVPDRLMQKTHGHYTDYAEKMLSVYREGTGLGRRRLHHQIESIFRDEPACPARRIHAFCKILDESGTFQTDAEGKAARLRLKVFGLAARFHPLVEEPDELFDQEQTTVKKSIAESLDMSWDLIEQTMYCDMLEYQRLEHFEGYADPAALLSKYNVAQLQACLYRAVSMTVTAGDDLKTIIRYAKLARLLHEIVRLAPRLYRITFSGPASVLMKTRRYGVNFAKFLPALLACRGWHMTALLKTAWNTTASLDISDKDGFTSHLPSPRQFDSALEESLARKFGAQRNDWRMIREGTILHDRQKTFIPDFVFRHSDGTEVLFEIAGFWTPEYLAQKRQTLEVFRRHNVLLALPQSSLKDKQNPPEGVLVYKTKIKLNDLMALLEKRRLASQLH